MQAIYQTKTPEETIQLGERLGYILKGGDTVLLFGDLGSGKTHFAKGIAKGLGIKETVKSPTFVYVNEYPIPGLSFPRRRESTCLTLDSRLRGNDMAGSISLFHYDLYRLNPGDDLSSIGITETLENSNAINIVEWADRIICPPEKHIHVEFDIKDDCHKTCPSGRRVSIRFTCPEIVPKNKITALYDEWAVPLHVRSHIKQVTHVAMKIADAFIALGEIINLNLLYSATMLHDLCRVCDFNKINYDDFIEDITDEKIIKWKDLRKTHKNIHHADIAYNFLNEIGYHKTAEIIYIHKSRVIAEEPERINTLEKQIMFYADKRVKHDEIVSLKERFRDGVQRHGKENDKETKQMFRQIEEKTLQMEKELFTPLNIFF